MKKVLIITYYWIPSGGAGVQRWIKFTKYLRDFGWEPIIYTPENPEYPSEDYSFEKDIPDNVQILKKRIWEPYNIYRNLFGKKGEKINAGFISENKKKSWKEKLSVWIRGNFLIPDPRRFWIKPSVKFLEKFIGENQVDAIISTGPPHSMHLIGRRIKKAFPSIPWIVDFRDPWTKIDFYRELHLTLPADKRHQHLEKKVIQSADCVIVVSQGMLEDYRRLNPKRIELLTNGFDEDDLPKNQVHLDKDYTLSHIGTLNEARNPSELWKVLRKICQSDEQFDKQLKIQLIGKTDYSVLEDIQNNGLEKNLIKIDYLSHNEAIAKQLSSQVLLLLINKTENAKGILTGKFFEYLAAQRPILAVGPADGDVAKILDETKAGFIADFEDEETLQKIILNYYLQFQKGNLQLSNRSIEKYSRKNLTCRLVEILDELSKNQEKER